jgi:hypothetical protein
MPADSAAMKARFSSMLAGFEHGQETQQSALATTRPKSAEPWWPHALMQAAAAIVFFALGALAGRDLVTPESPEPDETLSALRGEVREMRQLLTLSLLQQDWATERLRGVAFSGLIENPGREVVDALLDALMHDPNVNVRLAVVDALGQFSDEQRVRDGAVEALERADSPLVQVALIDALVELSEARSMDTLRRLSTDPAVPEAVRLRAVWGLSELEATL